MRPAKAQGVLLKPFVAADCGKIHLSGVAKLSWFHAARDVPPADRLSLK